MICNFNFNKFRDTHGLLACNEDGLVSVVALREEINKLLARVAHAPLSE